MSARLRPYYARRNGMSARNNIYVSTALCLFIGVLNVLAQQPDQGSQSPAEEQSTTQQMPGMQMPQGKRQDQASHCSMQGMEHKHVPGRQINSSEQPKTFIETIRQHGASGTSAE